MGMSNVTAVASFFTGGELTILITQVAVAIISLYLHINTRHWKINLGWGFLTVEDDLTMQNAPPTVEPSTKPAETKISV